MNIGLFIGNDNGMSGYIIGMHIDMRTIKSHLAIVYSSEFNNMSLNSKRLKSVSYIQDNKACERIYVILKLHLLCIQVLFLADIKKAGM